MASRSSKKSGESGIGRRALRTVGGGLAVALRFAGVPVMGLLIYVGAVWCLWQYSARGAVRPGDPRTDAASCPWLAPRDVAEINSAVRFGRRASIYDRDICGKVARRYAANPWVDEVVSVRRRFPNSVEVDLAVRRPFAYVNRRGRYHLVDSSGCRLPVRSSAKADGDYPVIEGVRTPLPGAGEYWTGRPLSDALRLALLLNGVLEGRGPGMRLTRVRIDEERGSIDSLPQMVARTESGMVIDWGSYSESSTALFPSVVEKRRELEKALDAVEETGAIESIMVRYKAPSVRHRRGWSRSTSGARRESSGVAGTPR
jgi:hypothetical protein